MPPLVGSNAQWALHTDLDQGEPGGREMANRGRKRERKRRRKGREKKKKKKMHQDSTAARLCQYKTSPYLLGYFAIHQITKKTVALWVFLATGYGQIHTFHLPTSFS